MTPPRCPTPPSWPCFLIGRRSCANCLPLSGCLVSYHRRSKTTNHFYSRSLSSTRSTPRDPTGRISLCGMPTRKLTGTCAWCWHLSSTTSVRYRSARVARIRRATLAAAISASRVVDVCITAPFWEAPYAASATVCQAFLVPHPFITHNPFMVCRPFMVCDPYIVCHPFIARCLW
jgi:hypothetical protein